MAQEIETINKYEFYDKFIQFLYPSLIINIDYVNAHNKNEEKKQDNNNEKKESSSSLYNSSTFNLSTNNDQKINDSLIMDLRDQGSEYFTKLLVIVTHDINDKNIQQSIKQLCNNITIASKSIKTFYIFHNKNNIFVNEYKILTAGWYNAFKDKYNTTHCFGYPSLPTIIENNLFIGGRVTVQNSFILKSLNISVIINCTKDCPNYFESEKEIIYHRIAIDDSDNENILIYLQQCYKLLNDYIDNKNLKVLIHCEQGKSRSVSMVVYYLMIKYQFNVQQSLEYVKNLRAIASPNKGFMDQLQQLYQQTNQNNDTEK
eukprot:392963_1